MLFCERKKCIGTRGILWEKQNIFCAFPSLLIFFYLKAWFLIHVFCLSSPLSFVLKCFEWTTLQGTLSSTLETLYFSSYWYEGIDYLVNIFCFCQLFKHSNELSISLNSYSSVTFKSCGWDGASREWNE